VTATRQVFISHPVGDHPAGVLVGRLAAGLRAYGVAASTPADREQGLGAELDSLADATDVLLVLSKLTGEVEELCARVGELDGGVQAFVLPIGDAVAGFSAAVFDGFVAVPSVDEVGGQVTSLFQALGLRVAVPADLVDLVSDKTADFVGREYVFDAINGFIAENPSGMFRLAGDPGDGKTAILAEYVRRTGCPAHFNIRAQGVNTSRHFLRNLGAALAERYESVGAPDVTDPSRYGEMVARLLSEARAELADGLPLVVVIDALDEVDDPGLPFGVNVLHLPRHLPRGVYLLVSSRRAEVTLRMEVATRVYDLTQHRDLTEVDIGTYLTTMGTRLDLAGWRRDRAVALADFVDVLLARSEGNFMYLRYVLPELTSGFYRNLDIRELPYGLNNYYADHWRLMRMDGVPSTRIKVWVVYLLCQLARPVSLPLLGRILQRVVPGVDLVGTQQVLTEWAQFLHREAARQGVLFSIYHSSFREFLHRQDVVASAGLSVSGVDGVIADVLFEYEYGTDG
jgi:hypothetical protein